MGVLLPPVAFPRFNGFPRHAWSGDDNCGVGEDSRAFPLGFLALSFDSLKLDNSLDSYRGLSSIDYIHHEKMHVT